MSYATEVLADSPDGYWRLDEVSGTTATDSSGNGNHGTYVGTTADTALFASSSGSRYFDGLDDYVTVPWFTGLGSSTAYTLEGWMDLDADAGESTLVGDRGSDGSGFFGTMIRSRPSDTAFQARHTVNSTTVVSVGATDSDLTRLVHLAITWDGTAVRIYVDGALVGSPANQAGYVPARTPQPLTIGVRQDDGEAIMENWLKGRVSDVARYPTTLSATRIQAHYDARNTVAPTLSLASKTSTTVDLSWTDGGTWDEYQIERDGVVIDTIPGLTYTDTGLSPDTAYDYRVRGARVVV